MNRCKKLFSKSRLLTALANGLLTVILLVCCTAVIADPVVKLDTYNFDSGLTSQAIQVFVYDDPASGPLNMPRGHGIEGMDLNVTIADGNGHASNGGPVFHLGTPHQGYPNNSGYVGPGAGPGAGADVITGTIFQSLPHTIPADGSESVAQNLFIAVGATSGIATISTTPGVSLVATLYIDTVGVEPGTNWALKIGQFSNDPNSPDYHSVPFDGPLDFADEAGDPPFNTVLIDGVIHINNVPEPSSLVLAGVGFVGLALFDRRRRCRELRARI